MVCHVAFYKNTLVYEESIPINVTSVLEKTHMTTKQLFKTLLQRLTTTTILKVLSPTSS